MDAIEPDYKALFLEIPVLLFLDGNRNIDSFSNALGYNAKILKQVQATLQFLRIRFRDIRRDFHVNLADAQPAFLIARVLDRHLRMHSLHIQPQLAR